MTKQTRQLFECQVRKVDEDNKRISFVASTEDVARDGSIILAKGWKLDNYRKNPVFLWAHNGTQPPIGKVVSIEKRTDLKKPRLEIEVEFAGLDQLHEQAEMIFRLYRDGFLNAVSVAFMPTKAKKLSDKEREELGLSPWGQVWTQAELFEVSAVPVPADAGAVKKGMEDALLACRGLVDDEDLAEQWDEAIRELTVVPESQEVTDGNEDTTDATTEERTDAINDVREAMATILSELQALKSEVRALKQSVADELVDDLDEEVERSTVSHPAPHEDLINDLDDPYDISDEVATRLDN